MDCRDKTKEELINELQKLEFEHNSLKELFVKYKTTHEQAIKALQESEIRHRALYESSRDAIMTLEPPNWLFTSGNLSTLQMFLAKDEVEFTSREPWELSPEWQPDGRRSGDKAKEVIGIAMREGSHFFEWTHRRLNGEDFPASVLLTRMEIDEKVFLQATVRDITELKKAEEKLVSYTSEIELKNKELDVALANEKEATLNANEMAKQAELANKAKSVFLANMSHEIRTPLNAIIGYSQLINRDPKLTPTQKDYIDSTIGASEHLLKLINDILELSKIEAGRVMLNPGNIDLIVFLEDIERIFKERTHSKQLQFLLEVSDSILRYIIVDENKLRQIFINLIGNAVKFTDKGGIAVRIRIDKVNESSYLYVEIEDSGPGIAENELNMLFKHFVQTSSGIEKGSGSGLGLALSKELAVLMGGDVSVTSQVGKGSIFTFWVEIKEGEVEFVESKSTKRVISIDKAEKAYRILAVDDQKDNLRILVNLLKLVGFETNEALNGEEAIMKFNEWNPDLILMDLRMPVMDGYEATRRIKLTEKGSETPVIILSASTFEGERKRIDAMGIQGFIRKPFREDELFDKLQKVLGVKYIYEEEAPSTQSKYLLNDEAIADDIENLPNELVSKMNVALSVADFDMLIDLINSIDPKYEELAKYLKSLANNFDYDYLHQLLNRKETKS